MVVCSTPESSEAHPWCIRGPWDRTVPPWRLVNELMKQCKLTSAGELQESLQGYHTAEAHSNHPPNEAKSIFKRLYFNLWSLNWTQNTGGGWHLKPFIPNWLCRALKNCLAEEVEGFQKRWNLGRLSLMRDLSGISNNMPTSRHTGGRHCFSG